MNVLPGLALLSAAGLAGVQWARHAADRRQAAAAWATLAGMAPQHPAHFDPALVAGLPEPARRYFNYVIQPGARLGTVAEIVMVGALSLGSKASPGYRPMRARQLLAPPHGLVWQVSVGSGLLRATGADAMVGNRSWTRFWALGVLPLVRAGGDADHLRSSAGRVVAEAAFWSPASLLPGPGISWRLVDADTARATVALGDWTHAVDIHVNADGRPLWVSIARWSNANADRVFRLQPFGGQLSDFRMVAGFRLPFRVDGGNLFGTPDYFPFYRARVLAMRVL